MERDDRHLIINGKKIRVYSEDDAANIPWDDCGAEYIIESTGAYCTTEKASAHFRHGAKKVIISAPAKDDITPTFVMGVNHKRYTPDMDVVSNASCTTNCLAPMTKVINDTFGIEQALMSTIHAATAKQKAVDARAGRDWRTGRSVLGNIIPSTTGAAKAVGVVIPELKGKMTGMSFRVPTNDVSVVDLTARLNQPASYHDVCVAMENAAQNSMKGIITCTTRPGGVLRPDGLFRDLHLRRDRRHHAGQQLCEADRLVRQRVGLHQQDPGSDGLHAYSGPEPVIRFLGRGQLPASYFFHINIVLCTLSIKY